ncbi:hypothetical protein [Kribbella endophytica]
MRSGMTEPPNWLTGVLSGLLFGVAFGAFVKHDGAGWGATVGTGLAAGAFFGFAMGRWGGRWARTMREAESELSAEELKAAHQAADRGPVPDDPRIRAAALKIATAQQTLEVSGVRRIFLQVVSVVVTAGIIVSAITESPWNLLFLVGPVAIGYGAWVAPRRSRARIRLLSSAAD